MECENMDCPLKRLLKSWRELQKKIYSLQLFSDGSRGASDHRKDFRNGNFRRFAIGAMLLFSLRVGLDEKLQLIKVCKVVTYELVEASYCNCVKQ